MTVPGDRRARTAHVPVLGLAALRGGAVGGAGLVLAGIASVDGVDMFVGGAAAAVTLGLTTGLSVAVDRRLARRGGEPTVVPWLVLALGACAAVVDAAYAAGVFDGGPMLGVERVMQALQSDEVVPGTLLGAALFASAVLVARPEEHSFRGVWPAASLAAAGTTVAWAAALGLGSRGADVLPLSAMAFALLFGLPAAVVLAVLFRLADRLALRRWPYLGVEASSSRSE